MNELKTLFEQAREGNLPQNFDRWDLKDEWGISVAHVAAKHGHLPPDFDQWGLKDGFGLSVAQESGLRDGVHPLVMFRIKPEDLGKWFRTENYQNYLKSTRKPTSLDLVILRMFERSR